MSKNVLWVVARSPERLKSTCFEIFSHSASPFPSGPLGSKKSQKTLILAFEANSALSHENESKIVKITNSEQPEQNFTTWPRVVESSQLVMGLMKTRRNLNFEVSKREKFYPDP